MQKSRLAVALTLRYRRGSRDAQWAGSSIGAEEIAAGSIEARSWTKVCGFIAGPGCRRRPVRPKTCFAYAHFDQVGKAEPFAIWRIEDVARRDGDAHSRMERANRRFALADPEPLTLANRMTKSFTGSACVSGLRHLDGELHHVPSAGRAAFGAEPAVQAEILVLHHHPPGLDRLRDVDRLGTD